MFSFFFLVHSSHSDFLSLFFLILVFFAMLCGMKNLSSLTRVQTHAPCIGSAVLTTGPPGSTSPSRCHPNSDF